MNDATTPRILLVLTTVDEQTDVSMMARTLIEEQLAACVNVLPPMTSIYRWKGTIESAQERQMLIKTTSSAVEALVARLTELHPYDVPEILVVPVLEAAHPYADWVRQSVAGQE